MGDGGFVTVETKSNHTVIMHHRKYTRASVYRCCSKTNIFFPSALFLWSARPLLSAECQRSAPDTVVMMSIPHVRKAKATGARK